MCDPGWAYCIDVCPTEAAEIERKSSDFVVTLAGVLVEVSGVFRRFLASPESPSQKQLIPIFFQNLQGGTWY